MKNIDKVKNYKFIKKLINKIYLLKKTKSVTVVGSFSKHLNFKKSNDIDIVVICDELTKSYYNNTIKIVLKNKSLIQKLSCKTNLIINTAFGPVKFDNNSTQVIHLMIYDINGHIQHSLKSPFTCYDWEKSNLNVGFPLSSIASVYKLQINDFINLKNSAVDFLNCLNKNFIILKQYQFKNRKYKIHNKKIKINDENKNDFIYHIIKFSISNYNKLINENNTSMTQKKIFLSFLEITKSKRLLKIFIKIYNHKYSRTYFKKINVGNLVNTFLIKFINLINKKYLQSPKVSYFRHARTDLNKNIFLGQKIDNKINFSKISKKINFNEKFDHYFSSELIRSQQTIRLFRNNKKIIISRYLNELDYGKCEGMTIKQVKKAFPIFYDKLSKNKDPRFINGENTKDILRRVKDFNNLIIKFTGNKKIIVMTHNVFLRCLLGTLFKIDKNLWYLINVSYLERIDCLIINKKIIPNINRTQLSKIFENLYYNQKNIKL